MLLPVKKINHILKNVEELLDPEFDYDPIMQRKSIKLKNSAC